jgi:hypothetical protein
MQPRRLATIGESRGGALDADWEQQKKSVRFAFLFRGLARSVFFVFVLNLTTATAA